MLLPDGRILVSGGSVYAAGTHISSELYDPASGTWSAAGTMAQNRYEHTGTLTPDNKVVVAGRAVAGPDGSFPGMTVYGDNPLTGNVTEGAFRGRRSI